MNQEGNQFFTKKLWHVTRSCINHFDGKGIPIKVITHAKFIWINFDFENWNFDHLNLKNEKFLGEIFEMLKGFTFYLINCPFKNNISDHLTVCIWLYHRITPPPPPMPYPGLLDVIYTINFSEHSALSLKKNTFIADGVYRVYSKWYFSMNVYV